MENIKKISVTITYKVGLGEIKAPENVIKQLKKAHENNIEISTGIYQDEYDEAYEWLIDNIKEKDCYDWTCEIDSFNT